MSNRVTIAGFEYHAVSEEKSSDFWNQISYLEDDNRLFRFRFRSSQEEAFVLIDRDGYELCFFILDGEREWEELWDFPKEISKLISSSDTFTVMTRVAPTSLYSQGTLIPARDICRLKNGSIVRCRLADDKGGADKISLWVVSFDRIINSEDVARGYGEGFITPKQHPRETWYVVYNPEAV